MNIPSEVKIGPMPAAEITGAHKALAFAQTITVTDQRGYELAAEEVRAIKDRHNRIELKRQELKAPLLEAARSLDAFFKEALHPLAEAEKLIKGRMGAYSAEQERIATEARKRHDDEVRRARLEAERKAEEERRMAADEARRQREEAARKERDAEEAALREREARTKGERELAEKARLTAEADARAARDKAAAASLAGEHRAEAALASAQAMAAAPVPVAEKPQAPGTSTRIRWKHRVVDFKRLVQAVAEGRTPIEVIAPNEKELDRLATALRHGISAVCPGVEAVPESSVAITRG